MKRNLTVLFIFCVFQAAGLATMISTMRPDIDNLDEYVRNTTARAFAVVASALGIPSLLPFLKAVCKSKKSWQARHTGIKIVQQIAILMGCAILPHLKNLVEIIEHGELKNYWKFWRVYNVRDIKQKKEMLNREKSKIKSNIFFSEYVNIEKTVTH